jgi:hypothetical protein
MKQVCGWCGKDLGDSPDPPTPGCEDKVSHGICPACRAALVADAAKATEAFGDDELEAHAAKARRPMVGTGQDKVYHGVRRPDGCRVTVNGNPLALRLDVQNHSPTGFAWGYGGSGPAQLALALLCDFLGDDRAALELYQEFKFRVVANLPHEAWCMTGDTLKSHIETIRAGQGHRLGIGGPGC